MMVATDLKLKPVAYSNDKPRRMETSYFRCNSLQLINNTKISEATWLKKICNIEEKHCQSVKVSREQSYLFQLKHTGLLDYLPDQYYKAVNLKTPVPLKNTVVEKRTFLEDSDDDDDSVSMPTSINYSFEEESNPVKFEIDWEVVQQSQPSESKQNTQIKTIELSNALIEDCKRITWCEPVVNLELRDHSEFLLQTCSTSMFYNHLQNYGSQVLILDMRTMVKYLENHINFNRNTDHALPVPLDLLTKNNWKVGEFQKWVTKGLLQDELLNQLGIANVHVAKRFEQRRRKYVFVIGTHLFDLKTFELQKHLDDSYLKSKEFCEAHKDEGMRKQKFEDLASLQNAILLI